MQWWLFAVLSLSVDLRLSGTLFLKMNTKMLVHHTKAKR